MPGGVPTPLPLPPDIRFGKVGMPTPRSTEPTGNFVPSAAVSVSSSKRPSPSVSKNGELRLVPVKASNALMYIVVILLGTSVGATTSAEAVLNMDTLKIVALGLIAFAIGTAAGVLFGKLMCWATKGKVNPLIGSAGVSAVPMAARVSQKVGAEADPTNFLLMHAMGPNVAGVIGTAVAAGTFMAIFGVK